MNGRKGSDISGRRQFGRRWLLAIVVGLCLFLLLYGFSTQVRGAEKNAPSPVESAEMKRLQAALTTVIYTDTAALFPNPERGFYHHTETHSPGYEFLDVAELESYRQNENINLILRGFYLEDFVNSDISQTYLDAIQTDFDAIRQAGLKVVVRFAYTDQLPDSPPFGDATKTQVLRHIEQLTPLLQANGDVTLALQAGFIGVWGEWFYTDHFVADPANPDNVTPADYANRAEVVNALLTALPSDRMIQVRTPRFKVNMLPESAGYIPISPDQAYNHTPIARVGHHNDCFLASETDYGTYINLPIEYAYLVSETLYLSMGGETCNETTDDDPPSDRSLCPTALIELALFHWSFLNIDYHPGVIDSWDQDDCLAEIKQRLGYRFTLLEGTYPDEVNAGDTFTVTIDLQNLGWAAPFNPRPVELLLRHIDTSEIYYATLPDDPRFWLADAGQTYTLENALCPPADMPVGAYELLLNLPDPKPWLYGRADYAIRLANEGLWESHTGYNNLLHTLTINASSPEPVCDGIPLHKGFFIFLPIILRT